MIESLVLYAEMNIMHHAVATALQRENPKEMNPMCVGGI